MCVLKKGVRLRFVRCNISLSDSLSHLVFGHLKAFENLWMISLVNICYHLKAFENLWIISLVNICYFGKEYIFLCV